MSDLPTLRLFVFKEGLLSRLGHDLRLSVDRFELMIEGGNLVGRFDTQTIRVDGSVKNGTLVADGISPRNKAKVETIVRRDILRTDLYPEVIFEASVEPRGDCAEVHGSLTVLGRRRALDVTRVLPMGERIVAAATIRPTRWGIQPYRGLAGGLKLKDRIDVELAVPADVEVDARETHRWTRQPAGGGARG